MLWDMPARLTVFDAGVLAAAVSVMHQAGLRQATSDGRPQSG
jgi:hypothetical protein